MSGQVAISGWCKVSNNHVWVNGGLVFESPGSPDFGEFSKAAFKSLEQAYLKFYKMDNLSSWVSFVQNTYSSIHPLLENMLPKMLVLFLAMPPPVSTLILNTRKQ